MPAVSPTKLFQKKFFGHSAKSKRWLFSIKTRRSAKSPRSFRQRLLNTSRKKKFETADQAQHSLLALWQKFFRGKRKGFKTIIHARMKSLSPHLIKGQKTDSLAEANSKFPTTVSIVEDDENDCRLMIQALKQSGDFVFAGAYRSAEEALVAIPKIRSDLVLMDIRLPGMDGRECARRLRIIAPHLKIVFITGLLDLDTMYKSLRTGPDGYLTKPTSAAQFLAVLEKAVDSMPATEKASMISSREIDTSKACSFLTVREDQVMKLLSKGLLSKEVAEELGISFSAVHKHEINSYRKLGAHNRTEAINNWWNTSGP